MDKVQLLAVIVENILIWWKSIFLDSLTKIFPLVYEMQVAGYQVPNNTRSILGEMMLQKATKTFESTCN